MNKAEEIFEIESLTGFKFKFNVNCELNVLYYEGWKNFKALMKIIKNQKSMIDDLGNDAKDYSQIQSELVQTKNILEHTNKELVQLRMDYQTDGDLHNETHNKTVKDLKPPIKMPKYVSLVLELIDEVEEGFTITELSRDIKKSRSSVYPAVNWLLSNNYIVKQGTRYLPKYSKYNIQR